MNRFFVRAVVALNPYLFILGGVLVPLVMLMSATSESNPFTKGLLTSWGIGIFLGVLTMCISIAFVAVVIENQQKQIDLLQKMQNSNGMV